MKLRYLIVPLIALVAISFLAACSSDDDDGGGSQSDLYATQTAESASGGETPSTGETPGGSQGDETPAQAFSDACEKSDDKQWPEAPPRIIDTSKTYTATIKTEHGDIVLDLYSDVPITTNNFVWLSCKGYFNGLTFHRVISGFVAQGGDPAGDCTGGPGYEIPDEDSAGHTMDAGAISMAKSGPDSAGSQFFITYTAQPGLLDMGFTVFGKVRSGLEVMGQLTNRECGDPGTGDKIEEITIEES